MNLKRKIIPGMEKAWENRENLTEEEIDEFFRAEGECICKDCGHMYKEHPSLEKYPWLVVLCNRDVIKL